MTFNRGFYTIDMRFFYRVTLQVYTGSPRYSEAEGLCVFDKRCILFGSEGNAKIFSSDTVIDDMDIPGRVRSNLPIAVVEAARLCPLGLEKTLCGTRTRNSAIWRLAPRGPVAIRGRWTSSAPTP